MPCPRLGSLNGRALWHSQLGEWTQAQSLAAAVPEHAGAGSQSIPLAAAAKLCAHQTPAAGKQQPLLIWFLFPEVYVALSPNKQLITQMSRNRSWQIKAAQVLKTLCPQTPVQHHPPEQKKCKPKQNTAPRLSTQIQACGWSSLAPRIAGTHIDHQSQWQQQVLGNTANQSAQLGH